MHMKKVMYTIYRQLLRIPVRVSRSLTQQSRDLHLKNLIEGKRVLIVGAGPSIAQLSHIPEDVVLFSMNLGPQALLDNNLPSHIDLHMLNKRMSLDEEYLRKNELLSKKFTVSTLLYRDISFLRTTDIQNFETVIYDRSIGRKDDHLLRKLKKQWSKKDQMTLANDITPSSGMRLLEYALFYRAKEVYLAGMDLDTSKYKEQKENMIYATAHMRADHALIKLVGKYYNNVFTAVKSPIEDSIPFKKLV